MPRIRRSTAAAPKLVAVIFLLIGLVFSSIGFGFGWSSWSLLSVAQRTDGTVIRLVHRGGVQNRQVVKNKRRGAAPVVEFHLDGVRHEFQSWLSTSPPQFSVGDDVTVLYDPHDTQRAGIDSFVTLWLFPTVFGGIGVVMLTVSAIIVGVSWLKSMPASTMPTDTDSLNFLDERSET